MKRSDAWWTDKFMELYYKEPTPEEMKQFKKSYYEPKWGNIESIRKSKINKKDE